ncbi:MAG: hypothetical protein QOC94_1128 [Actinoplanes sp.]|jgi:hypothetical protein|nr:hypothetical protein [Actinoplanes sp.]
MNGRASSYDGDSDYLSDDELDTISGGIPQLGHVPTSEPGDEFDLPQFPVLQERPTADPGMWF